MAWCSSCGGGLPLADHLPSAARSSTRASSSRSHSPDPLPPYQKHGNTSIYVWYRPDYCEKKEIPLPHTMSPVKNNSIYVWYWPNFLLVTSCAARGWVTKLLCSIPIWLCYRVRFFFTGKLKQAMWRITASMFDTDLIIYCWQGEKFTVSTDVLNLCVMLAWLFISTQMPVVSILDCPMFDTDLIIWCWK